MESYMIPLDTKSKYLGEFINHKDLPSDAVMVAVPRELAKPKRGRKKVDQSVNLNHIGYACSVSELNNSSTQSIAVVCSEGNGGKTSKNSDSNTKTFLKVEPLGKDMKLNMLIFERCREVAKSNNNQFEILLTDVDKNGTETNYIYRFPLVPPPLYKYWQKEDEERENPDMIKNHQPNKASFVFNPMSFIDIDFNDVKIIRNDFQPRLKHTKEMKKTNQTKTLNDNNTTQRTSNNKCQKNTTDNKGQYQNPTSQATTHKKKKMKISESEPTEYVPKPDNFSSFHFYFNMLMDSKEFVNEGKNLFEDLPKVPTDATIAQKKRIKDFAATYVKYFHSKSEATDKVLALKTIFGDD